MSRLSPGHLCRPQPDNVQQKTAVFSIKHSYSVHHTYEENFVLGMEMLVRVITANHTQMSCVFVLWLLVTTVSLVGAPPKAYCGNSGDVGARLVTNHLDTAHTCTTTTTQPCMANQHLQWQVFCHIQVVHPPFIFLVTRATDVHFMYIFCRAIFLGTRAVGVQFVHIFCRVLRLKKKKWNNPLAIDISLKVGSKANVAGDGPGSVCLHTTRITCR